MWVIFLAIFDFDPPERFGRTTITYRPGSPVLVRRICAEAAIARGLAVLAERPAREVA